MRLAFRNSLSSKIATNLATLLSCLCAPFYFSLLLTPVFSMALPTTAKAQEQYDFYRGVRQMGMGGAYTAVVNDETAVLSNPAGLGKLRETTLTLIDPQLSGSFSDTGVLTLGTASHATNMQELLGDLNNHPGKHFNAGAQVFPSFVGPNFGLGFYGNYTVNAEVDPTKTTYTYHLLNDYATAMGYCFRFFGGIVKLGVAGRLIDRTESAASVPATSTGLSAAAISQGGLGLGGDVGLTLTAPVQFLPTLSAVVRDVGGTNYALSEGFMAPTASRPPDTPQTIDAGAALFPIFEDHTRASITVEAHDVLNIGRYKSAVASLHAGGELNFSDFFFLRAGYNEGYWTAGLEFDTAHLQIQVASYGEEVGIAPIRQEDRRWMVKTAYRF